MSKMIPLSAQSQMAAGETAETKTVGGTNETKSAQQTMYNPVQEYLFDTREFRRNVLNGKVELRERPGNQTDGDACTTPQGPFRPLTLEELNSIVLDTEAALPGEKCIHRRITTIINSCQTPVFDPAREWLESLPAWDGKNHVGALLDRLPGLRAEQRYWLTIWLLSMVAHWLQMDSLHGNEVVPTFIGEQGCGKSTFCRLLLPPELREYFLDHVNLGNKFDKEMALTNNLLVNIDELDQVRRSQQAELKQLLSKSRVNGRPIYGRAQDDRLRYASFVATTNNRHPLHDPTGSRRFLCVEIPDRQRIENETPIDYDQLYAQLLTSLRAGERYWFSEEETRALQRANAPYESTMDLERMVQDCLRRPAEDEVCKPMTTSEIMERVRADYPALPASHSTKIQLGFALKELGFQCKRDNEGMLYFALPKTA